MTFFDFAVLIVAALAGGIASVSGFGIGSLLTPLLTLQTTTKLAVSIVSIPHFVGTFVRFWFLRHSVDKHVLISFGIMSAVFGLVGALFHDKFGAPALTLIFALILIFAGGMGSSGLSEKLSFERKAAWVAGAFSGGLGGLVGNQGGIRSAALLSFDIKKDAFVATATAIGVVVDLARVPVYFISDGHGILAHKRWLILGITGVLFGTLLGMKLLKHLPEKTFRRIVSALVLVLGIMILIRAIQA